MSKEHCWYDALQDQPRMELEKGTKLFRAENSDFGSWIKHSHMWMASTLDWAKEYRRTCYPDGKIAVFEAKQRLSLLWCKEGLLEYCNKFYSSGNFHAQQDDDLNRVLPVLKGVAGIVITEKKEFFIHAPRNYLDFVELIK